MKLSKPYLDLLAELENNARQSLSQIAQKLKTSSQLIAYRLKSLQKRNIVYGFYTVINYTAFGYTNYRTMFRLVNITKETLKKIISYLLKQKNVIWLAECGGRWDLIVTYMAKNITEFNDFLKKLLSKFPHQLHDYDVLITVELVHLGRDYFSKEKRENKYIAHIGGKHKLVKIDKIGLTILELISLNARISASEISERIGISTNSVIQRIRNMKKKEIILGFKPLIHLENTPYSAYKAILKLQNITEKKEKEIINFVKKDVNCIGTLKLFGPWNFEIEFEVDSRDKMLEITRNFRNEFKDVIKEFEVIPLYYEYKYNNFPSTYSQSLNQLES